MKSELAEKNFIKKVFLLVTRSTKVVVIVISLVTVIVVIYAYVTGVYANLI